MQPGRAAVIIPTVLSLAVIGAYAPNGNMTGPATLAVFAVLGWLLQRFECPVSAAVVGLLLAKLTEGAMMRTCQMSGSNHDQGTAGSVSRRAMTLCISAFVAWTRRVRSARPLATSEVAAQKDARPDDSSRPSDAIHWRISA